MKKYDYVIVCARIGSGYEHTPIAGIDVPCGICEHEVRLCDSSVRAAKEKGFYVNDNPPAIVCMECATEVMKQSPPEPTQFATPSTEQLKEIRETWTDIYIQSLVDMGAPKEIIELYKNAIKK